MRVTFFERCGCLTVGALSLLSCVGDGASDTDVFGGSVVQSERTYGFGKPATPDEIAAWDIDAMPDGTGLPEGQGSVAEGALVYEQKCIACHGATGTEGPYNRLVGRVPDDAFPFANDPSVRLTIGNYWPYATTLFDYTLRAMPFDFPGSLTANETYAVSAYLLYLNEIIAEDAVLNAETLPRVAMPARDRFVRDDRRGGPVIR